MESAAALMPASTGLNGLVFYFLLKLNIPDGPEYENTTLYQWTGESLIKSAGVKSKFFEKRTYQNSENVQNILNTWPGLTYM